MDGMSNFILEITDLNQQGQGVGRLDGQVVFVEGAIPGDAVRVDILSRARHYAVATVAELLRPSPDRVTPFCPVAERCGGCALQPMAYPAQLAHKRRHVVELLQRIGRLPEADALVRPVLGMAEPFAYRCKIQFPIRGTVDQPEIGFYARRSHDVVDSTTCAVGHPVGDRVRAVIRRYIQQFKVKPYDEATHSGSLRHLVVRVGHSTGQVMVMLVSRTNDLPGRDWLKAELTHAIATFVPGPACPAYPASLVPSGLAARSASGPDAVEYALTTLVLNLQPARTNVILGRQTETWYGPGWIEDRLLGLTFRISPLSFFQVNPRQTEVLYQLAIDRLALKPGETCLDLYCGTGTIALALARSVQDQLAASDTKAHDQPIRVTGVESVAPAIADARINAAQNGLEAVEFVVAEAETWLPDAVARGAIHPTAAVIDPPRRGCDDALLATLTQIQLERLVYVSCNPATLARDLERLSAAYSVVSVQPVDLFPWTDSVECVCLLVRREAQQ